MPIEQLRTYGGFKYSSKLDDFVDPSGTSTELRRQSLEVFKYLADHSDHLVPKDDIIASVWGDVLVTGDSLTKCVSEIRKALGDTEHLIIKTVPRRGFILVSDTYDTNPGDTNPGDTNPVGAEPTDPMQEISPLGQARNRVPVVKIAVAVLSLAILGFLINKHYSGTTSVSAAVNTVVTTTTSLPLSPVKDTVEMVDTGAPTLAVSFKREDGNTLSPLGETLLAELHVAFNRYRSVRLVDGEEAEFQLVLHLPASATWASRLYANLTSTNDGSNVYAESFEISDSSGEPAAAKLGIRLASAIASPGVGATDRYLLSNSKLKPVSELSKAECYANGYGCSKCSGEEDNINPRAEACLANIIEKDPDDSRAWALQATIYAHQYWWGNTLAEPLRSDVSLRRHLPRKAIEAASKAEKLSDGNDTAVYWGMAEAYYSNCQVDQLHTAIQRGIEINPNDPNLLASFGNWLAYSGRWDEGSAMTRRALEIEPRRYRKWWWMGIAKTHYFKGEFKKAHAAFLKAFNERNWLSHLQLAYTLPHLGRIEEARKFAASAEDLHPGLTIEKVLETYKILCFPDSFLLGMKNALQQTGLPSRGNSDDLSNIKLPRAKLMTIDGLDIEYIDVGTGEPVLFVHGAVSDYRSWGHYLAPVSENHRFISYSRRYYGTQPWKDDGENYSDVIDVNDLINFIEALNVGPVHLVSWSSGVSTALPTSVSRPDLVKSAIHFEPVEDNIFAGDDDPELRRMQEAWFLTWRPADERVEAGDLEGGTARLIENVFEIEPGAFEQEREMQKEINRQNARTMQLSNSNRIELNCEYVAQAEVPTLIVKGGNTLEYWQKMSERFQQCIPGAFIETIAGANHRAPLDTVSALSEVVLGFVEKNK